MSISDLANLDWGFDEDEDDGTKNKVPITHFKFPDEPLADMDDFFSEHGDLLRGINGWVIAPLFAPTNSRLNAFELSRTIAANSIVAAYNINPDQFSGVKLPEIAYRLGLTKQALTQKSSDFRKQFPIRNKFLRSPEQREKMREAQLQNHWRRKKAPKVSSGGLTPNKADLASRNGEAVKRIGGVA